MSIKNVRTYMLKDVLTYYVSNCVSKFCVRWFNSTKHTQTIDLYKPRRYITNPISLFIEKRTNMDYKHKTYNLF